MKYFVLFTHKTAYEMRISDWSSDVCSSDLRDFNGERLAAALPFHKGDWYNAKVVEDSIDSLKETAGLVGYAFAGVEPGFHRDREHPRTGGRRVGKEGGRTCRSWWSQAHQHTHNNKQHEDTNTELAR